jgi:DnaA family protein
MTRQLTLDLLQAAEPTLDNFFPGLNTECVALLRRIASGDRTQRCVHLWGPPGSGRSHLLRGLAGSGPVTGPDSALSAFTHAPGRVLHLVDDVDRLDPAHQEALFHLCNQVRADPACALVTAGNAPPMGLALREDLRTRLGWGLVFELRLLSDTEKADALRRAAEARGVAVSADVVPWMLTHRSRDIRALIEQFDALDRYAFERKRPITLPLLREWLQVAFSRAPGSPDADR